jgi:hypothetical protein
MSLLRKLRAIGTTGSASLAAIALLLAPALAAPSQRTKASRATTTLGNRPVGAFTPAVSDPRLAAALARRGSASGGDFTFTPSSAPGERSRALRVAVRARSDGPVQAGRTADAGPASTIATIAPMSYNLGVSVGWRRFAVSGDVAQSDGGLISGVRESAQVGMSYRATNRLTGRVAVAAERAEGAQRIVAADQAYSLDVGGAYSIARNVDVTAGARYRIARDRLDPIARDDRRDSQAVYIGTAFRF